MEMEYSDSPEIQQKIAVAESLWTVINTPVVKIFSDLKKSESEGSLRSFLELLTRSSENFPNILIPPFKSGKKFENLKLQYSAFTTWLFGVLFHVVGDPVNQEVLQNSIEVQACMLRILSRLHLTEFRRITQEYISIIDEILIFEVKNNGENDITIKKFFTQPNSIEKLDLTHFPVKITRKSLATTQISIMKIMIKSGVACWSQEDLWSRAIKLMINSQLESKLIAIEVISQLVIFSSVDNDQFQMFLTYSMEIIKTLDASTLEKTPEDVNFDVISQWPNVLKDLIGHLPNSPEVVDLCFSIIDALACDRIASRDLEISAVAKIRNYLIKHPRCYSPNEAVNLLRYLEKCPEFLIVIAHFVIYELNVSTRPGPFIPSESSPLWKFIHNSINQKSTSKVHLPELRRHFEIARTVSLWMSSKQVRGRLFDDPNALLNNLMNILENSDNQNDLQMIFSCLMELITIDDFPKAEIQKILLLPWFPDRSSSNLEVSRKLSATLKLLNTKTKIRCLEMICEFGRGRSRIKYLTTCIMSNEIEIGVSAVMNSILLLSDPEISFPDVNVHILKPAIIGQKIPLQEAVAKVIGSIVCFISKKAKPIRPEWDSLTWTIACDVCDKHFDHSPGIIDKFPIDEAIFSPYFAFLSSSNPVIRKNMSDNLIKFSNHLKIFNSNAISKVWLALIHDTDPEIRGNIANSIATLTRNRSRLLENDEDEEGFVDLVINELGEGLNQVLEHSNELLHMTLITTTKEFARAGLFSAERRICSIFIISIMHAESSYTAMASATMAFKEVAGFYKLSMKNLFLRYRKDMVELMTQLVANNYSEKNYNIGASLNKVVHCIGYTDMRQFVRKDGSLIVSYLVPMVIQVPKVRDIFKDIANLLDLDEREMFMDYFQHICAHIFLNESPEMGAECLELISKVAKLPIRDLMKRSIIGIFRKLLLHFHDKMERVLTCLAVISEFDSEVTGSFESPQSIANYLKPHLHGVLVNFDTNLGPMSDQATQKAALGSLGALMKFMGAAHLSPLRYKILATLRTCLNLTRPGFRRLSCYAWNCFLRNVSLDDLGPLLPTICVSMIPLLDSCPNEANDMLKFLLIENNPALSMYISEIFFINDLRVSNDIAMAVSSRVKASTPNDFEACLKIWLRRITHETDEVRFKALIHLKNFLAEHRTQLNNMILSNTDVHPLVVELLDALLAGCQEKDESIRLKCGECLGELGAVEPSLLPRRIVSRNDSKFIPAMNEDFALEVLQELVRALQMEKITQNVDCFSLAIQEILKTFEISPNGGNRNYWNGLSSATQERILPFLDSHYKNTAIPDVVETPVYGSSAGSTFEKWLYSWTCSMIITVKDPKLSSLLNACQPALRRDTRTAMFCIPHIFIHIVTNGQELDRDNLINEIFAVIKPGDQTIDQELILRRPLRREIDEKPSDERVSDEARRIRCCQVIFSTLDHVIRWLGEKRLEKDRNYQLMESFFNRLDSLILAEACYKSHEYHRALMYLERHMISKNKGLSDQTESGLLAKIYTQLEEPDGVSGILASQEQSPTLQQLVVAHEVSGQLQDAATCYERLAQGLVQPKYIQGMIHCYLGLDQPFTAMKITEGILNSRPELEPLIVEHEPFWRLANFVQLAGDDNKSDVKRDLLDDLKRGIQPDLERIKKRLVSLLGATSPQRSYLQQSYPYIMKLHIINEFEKATSLMLTSSTNLPRILNEWEQREQLIRASRGVESVLGMRRATLDLFVELTEARYPDADISNLKEEIGKIWLKSAKIARKSGLYQQAYMYILSASDSCPPQELNIEQARLYWQRNCQEEAFITLKRSFKNCFQSADYYKQLPADSCPPDRRNFAKAKLLFAKYNEETLNVDTETNLEYYKEAHCGWKCWEKSLLSLAQYYEFYIEKLTEKQRDTDGKKMQYIINCYGRSLQYSCKYVHQSMPRMLTVWMDFAARVHASRNPSKEQIDTIERMTKIIDIYSMRLPSYVWLTALSQLVSRISHPSKVIQEQLIKILVSLIEAHPQYCLWMMACVMNAPESPDLAVKKIWNHERLSSPNIRKIMNDFSKIWKKLITFTNEQIPDGTAKATVSQLCRSLPQLLRSSGFGPIMMPTSQFFQLSLPARGNYSNTHMPFPNEQISIVGIDEQVVVMSSLQKPKKITLIGSDGGRYIFMCKPKDDLRRDFRLMEFNGIVNKYLQKNPESRQRRLYIRTYSVVPLNDNCGLIEWVPNLIPFRHVINGIHRERGLGISHAEFKKLIAVNDRIERKRKNFVEKILPKFPPVLGDWFRLTFPDPYGWYEARSAYMRTSAVMSMVGYILGLGDRHGENILLDCTCGDTVHVDFNCLFNGGELLKIPEKVPFRLTHNMVSAMGPLGYEGPFRKSSETTMRVLRQQANTLISVLKPFVYTEIEDAHIHVKNMEQRLAGVVKPNANKYDKGMTSTVKLSIEGQTNHLILDATNVDNLCQMFYGWGAHL